MKVKVLYYGMDWCLGGIEAFVKNMYWTFNKDKIQVDFLKTTDKIYYEEEFLKNGSEIYKLPSRRPNPITFYYSIIKFFNEHKEYKVIHLHLNTCSCIAPAIVAKFLGRKIIVHSHNNFKEKKYVKRVFYAINRHILSLFIDTRLACSVSAGQYMFKSKFFEVVNNGIQSQEYAYDPKIRDKYKKEFNIQESFVIGHVGRFEQQKNHEYLIEIFNEVHKKNNNAVLFLVGNGNLYSDIQKKVEQLGLVNSVIFAGVREDVNMILQAMDVFVLPSRFEGLGIAAIEAQAAGMHCIVSDAVPEETFVTDLIEAVPLNERPEIWANRILKYSNGYKRRDRVKEIVNSGFDRITPAKKLEQLYLKYYH